jgi:hypothetical protein
MTSFTVEEILSRAEHQAVLIRFAADAATTNPIAPDRAALGGLSDVAAEIERALRFLRRSLPATRLALATGDDSATGM